MLVTYTGKLIDYDNITKDDICLEDIAHALVKINRFNGHSSRAYTVAEHSIRCLQMAIILGYTNRQKLLVFIHDFTEAYVGDCPAPLKRKLNRFVEIEADVERAIYEHFNIEPPTEEEYRLIKKIDLTMLAIEMRDLTLHKYENFINENTYSEVIEKMKPITKSVLNEGALKEGVIKIFQELR